MIIDQSIIDAQRSACNPLHSVWVSASAGSGKTKVLTDRVLNLLLSDTRPNKILCLTFTKAAAAEMSNRITKKLKEWTIASTQTLIDELKALRGLPPTEEMILKARQLFVDVLETPGSMKIMTIHAFCQSVLNRFPIEAHISPQFNVIDDTRSSLLMKEAVNATFLNPDFQDDIDMLSDYFQEKDIQTIFNNILKSEAKFRQFFQAHPYFEGIKNSLKQKFKLSKYHSENDILIDIYNPLKFTNYTPDDVLPIKAVFEEHKKTYLTNEGEIRKAKKFQVQEAYDVFEAFEKIKMLKIIDLTVCVLRLIHQIIIRYEILKNEHAYMDYGDLIEKTKQLLTKNGMSQWVLYKMDEGIDHILVDEAQDTNPDQWEIIRLFSEEFFAGLGRESTVVRTIFVVGDKKQSIYSFQGADPAEFGRMQAYFKKKVTDSQHIFKIVPMNASFRSTQTVLDLVNHVLHFPKASKGVLEQTETADHVAVRKNEPGLIEIWPLVQVDKKEDNEIWPLPIKDIQESAMVVLANQIATKIKSFIDNKEELKSEGRPIEPKDIMILVSRRTGIVNELVRALKDRNIPVAGIDRLDLSVHIAVQDLLAIAKFALLPEDELNLAGVLKSPLIGMTEKQLMDMCINRETKNLWTHIQQAKPETAEKLKQILNLADKMPVYEFFATILGAFGGRKSLVQRLGTDANEAIDEFLALTLSFEQDYTPSLQNFINWFQNRNNTIKRDMEQGEQNTVKIMTVHGSKGLQSNIVFMPDAQRTPSKGETFFWADEFPIWIARKDLKNNALTSIYDEKDILREEEYHRLLYVALTRARDRLYICGWSNTKKKEENTPPTNSKEKEKTMSWHELVCQALPQHIQPNQNKIIHIESNTDFMPTQKEKKESYTQPDLPLPEWVLQQAPDETPLSKPLMPSRITPNEPQTESIIGTTQETALKRGIFLHKLIQYLPQVPALNRKEVAFKLKPDDIEIPENFFDIFDNQDFQTLFDNNSVAEVPIAGIVGKRVISGQIDRLIVTDNDVWIVDFKTNRQVPETPSAVHKSYKTQLFAYKSLIKNIFSDKIVRTFLLWTETMTLMEMTEEINLNSTVIEKELI